MPKTRSAKSTDNRATGVKRYHNAVAQIMTEEQVDHHRAREIYHERKQAAPQIKKKRKRRAVRGKQQADTPPTGSLDHTIDLIRAAANLMHKAGSRDLASRALDAYVRLQT